MASSPTVPKLLMAVDNGVRIGSPQVISWASQTFANAQVKPIGPGGHQIPEDQPDNIGAAVADWQGSRRASTRGPTQIWTRSATAVHSPHRTNNDGCD